MKGRLILLLIFAFRLNAQTLITPLERSDYSSLTKNSELIAFVQEAAKVSSLIKPETLAVSAEGKSIPVLKISRDEFGKSGQKIKVLVFAQQHGNEHSGKEAALILLKEIALGNLDYLFDKIDLLLVPQMNPDGNDKDQRVNGNGADLNRNHLILTEPEVIGLHKFFNRYMPEAALDVHEYSPFGKDWVNFGYRKNFDEQVGTLTNPNIYPELVKYQKEEYLPFIRSFLNKAGFSCNEYTVGGPPDKERLRYSTTDINDGRQSFGILNTFSFIVEGINGKESIDGIKRRAEGQYHAILGFLSFIHDNHLIIKNLVNQGREQLKNCRGEDVSIQMEHTAEGPKKMTFLSLRTQKDTTITLTNYHTKIETRYSVKMPFGYLIPKSDNELLSLLRLHSVDICSFKDMGACRIEQYFVKSKLKAYLEDLDLTIPEVEKKELNTVNYSDYFFVPSAQIHSKMLPLMLEPESMRSIAQYSRYTYLLKENSAYPVLRAEER